MRATYLLRPEGEWLVRVCEDDSTRYGAFSVTHGPCWERRSLRIAADYSCNFWWTDALEFA